MIRVGYIHKQVMEASRMLKLAGMHDYDMRLQRMFSSPVLPKETMDTVLASRVQETEGTKSLLIEIIRMAAYDYVLYKDSRKIENKLLADDAYTWLFEEDEQHARWTLRKSEGRTITAFSTICQLLDLNMNKIRDMVLKLTPHRVLTNRPPSKNARSTRPVEYNIALHVDIGGDGYDTGFESGD